MEEVNSSTTDNPYVPEEYYNRLLVWAPPEFSDADLYRTCIMGEFVENTDIILGE